MATLAENREKMTSLQTILANKAAGGGGVTLPTLDNPGDAAKLRAGYELIDQAGAIVTGTLEDVDQATPEITVSSGGLITATAEQEAGYVEAGSKSATQQLTTQGAQTITPGTADQTIASGRYLTGVQTIKGDANLKAANIVSGVSIFGVAGTAETGGGGGDTTLETCSLSVVTMLSYNPMIAYVTVEDGVEKAAVSTEIEITVDNLKKGSMVVIYARNNSSDSTKGAIASVGYSDDYLGLAYWVTGDASIEIT